MDAPTTDRHTYTGADCLVESLLGAGIDVCFANPGTSEMHFVGGLDRSDGMRCVLCLYEGVATGAADGYARMTRRPAATLLHLGPGLANGLSNLHNARRAASPVVNIVGDHASYHLDLDSPLTTDIDAVAAPFSAWVGRCTTPEGIPAITAEAVAAALTRPGGVATMILPGEVSWSATDTRPGGTVAVTAPKVDEAAVAAAADVLRGDGPNLVLLAGDALLADGLAIAGRIAAATGADLLAPTHCPRIDRGAGRVPVLRIPYPVDQALPVLAKYRHVILVGGKEPVAFFAYPDKPGRLLPEGCAITRLAGNDHDLADALARLADAVGAGNATLPLAVHEPAAAPRGPLNPDTIAGVLAANIPEDAIIADESITTGRAFFQATPRTPRHTWLPGASGSLGIGMAMAAGAAIASPGRRVISLEADGSAMYAPQALWTQARENLDVTTVIFANRGYQILKGEMKATGYGEPGRKARDMLEIDRPALDFVSLAKGMGVEGARAETAEALDDLMKQSLKRPGPFLIEAVL
ncbi:MAG: acetolactate synthase large subunit [Hyphomicrobiales bacterium]|nr:acetolactate synthase large subunit [Hyphomicrobiales bacterium]